MTFNLSIDDPDEFLADPYIRRVKAGFEFHSRTNRVPHKYWLVPGFVGEGDLTVVFAPPEHGKTTFVADMACRLAAGMGLDGTLGGTRRTVLYIANERKSQIQRIADAFCETYGESKLDNLILSAGPLDLMAEGELVGIARAAAESCQDSGIGEYIDLVILDTLTASMTGSDSDPSAMARAVNSINACLREGNYIDNSGGPAVLVVHHSTKEKASVIRGGSQLLGAADTTIQLSKNSGTFTAQVQKQNATPFKPAFHFKMSTHSFGKNEDDIETTAPVVVPCEPPKAANRTRRESMPANVIAALATLRAAIDANGGPVTHEKWREAVYAEAEGMKPGAKRVRYNRAKKAIEEYIIEDNGYFSIKDSVTVA